MYLQLMHRSLRLQHPYLTYKRCHSCFFSCTHVKPLYQVKGWKTFPNKLLFFLLIAVSVYECSDVGPP